MAKIKYPDTEKNFGQVHKFKDHCGKEIAFKSGPDGKGLFVVKEGGQLIEIKTKRPFSLKGVKDHKRKIYKNVKDGLSICYY